MAHGKGCVLLALASQMSAEQQHLLPRGRGRGRTEAGCAQHLAWQRLAQDAVQGVLAVVINTTTVLPTEGLHRGDAQLWALSL